VLVLAVVTRETRVIQYSQAPEILTHGVDYWIIRFRGR
jgi:hypothetical protein